MLETLRIRNIAVIDEAEIPFKKGLNILSGETGAGKSIVIEAISLLLGGRASADLVRSGCDEAIIEGFFMTREIPWIATRLERFGFSPEADSLLIRRIVSRTGRHRIYVNGEMATLAVLQELTEGLVDLCGQHEHQSLLRSQTQIELLDRYAGLEAQTRKVSEIFSGARSIRAELERLQASEAESSKRSDFLRFQIEELKSAKLSLNEDTLLQEEKKRLQSVDQRLQLVTASQSFIDGGSEDTKGALDLLRQVQRRMLSLQELDPSISELLDTVQRSLAEVEEASLALDRYASGCEIEPGRLEQIQERLSLFADLRRKYGGSVDEMFLTLARLESEWTNFENSGERSSALRAQLQSTETELKTIGEKLSAARKKIAKVLSDSVTAELRELRMEDAKFSIQIESHADLQRWSALLGADEVQFLVEESPLVRFQKSLQAVNFRD